MLYGIQRGEQTRLAAAREHVRVLIAYGTYWFPWYMRRLAERPANVWFVVKSCVWLDADGSASTGLPPNLLELLLDRPAGAAGRGDAPASSFMRSSGSDGVSNST